MDFTEEMDLLTTDTMNPMENKMLKELFKVYLNQFWTQLKEPDLPQELNNLWWWTKMHLITRMANSGDVTAKMMLEKELNRNGKKFENPGFELYRVSWK